MYRDIKLSTLLLITTMLIVIMGMKFGALAFIASASIAVLGSLTYNALKSFEKTMQEMSDTRGMNEEDKHAYFSNKTV